MRNVIDRARLVVKLIVGVVVFTLLAVLLCSMFLGGPIAMLAESYDLLRFDEQANGQLTHLDVVRGSKGTSGIRVRYTFQANEIKFESSQLYPGFAANNWTYSGGSSLSKNYASGAPVWVHYDSSDPTRSCLEYGWHQWSIGWTAATWGIVAVAAVRVRKSQLSIAAMTSMLYGFGMITIGPHTVLVHELIWHLLAILGIAAFVALYWFVRPNAIPTHWIWPASLALLLTGCGVPQAHTIHMPDEVVYEPSLIGTWETTIEGTLQLTFDVSRWSPDDNSYRFVVTSEGGTKPACEGRAYLSRIADRHYLTVGSADNQQPVPTYNTIVVDEWQQKLQVRSLNRHWLFRTIKADPTVIAHQGFPNADFLVTATTEELKEFFQKQLTEDGPWEKYTLVKKK